MTWAEQRPKKLQKLHSTSYLQVTELMSIFVTTFYSCATSFAHIIALESHDYIASSLAQNAFLIYPACGLANSTWTDYRHKITNKWNIRKNEKKWKWIYNL